MKEQSVTRLGRVSLHHKLSAHAGGDDLVLRANELASLLKPFGVIRVDGNVRIFVWHSMMHNKGE